MPDVVSAHVIAGDRRVDYCVFNAGASGRALFEYGTPGTRWLSPQMLSAAQRAGCALLVIDRPGYGESTRFPGRRIVDVAQDVVVVLQALGWDRCLVWGGSGGAPHALAIAALVPDRVGACASVVGLAPYDAPGVDWYAGMAAGNVAEFTAAARGEDVYRPLVQKLARQAMDDIEGGGIQVSAAYDLSESDRRALARRRTEGGYLDRMRLTYTEGIDGWIDDCIALTRPWGFDLGVIDVPTSVWHGESDVLGSPAQTEYLMTAIPRARRRVLPGGHVLDDDDLDNIYNWLKDNS